ncbi:MAG: hypothetical protein AAF805_07940 [Planctomycetota bacterium]
MPLLWTQRSACALVASLMLFAAPADAAGPYVFATSIFPASGEPGDSSLDGLLRVDLSDGSAEVVVPEGFNTTGDPAKAFVSPTDVAYDPVTDTVYVGSLGGRIWHFDASTGAPRVGLAPGESMGVFAKLLEFPVPGGTNAEAALGLMVDGGTLYASTTFGSVATFNAQSGALTGVVNTTPLSTPSGVSLARSGELIVASGNIIDPTTQPGELRSYDAGVETTIVASAATPGINAGARPTVVAPIADYDLDGTVNAGDYTAWVNAYDSDDARRDGNGDGLVDAADYTLWRDSEGEESRIVVADQGQNQLISFALDGTDGQQLAVLPPAIPPGADPASNFPSEVLVDADGTLIVGALGRTRRPDNAGALYRYDRDGTLLETFVTDLPPISGIAFAPAPAIAASASAPEPSTALLALVAAAAATGATRRR